jgi:hypothetical protein
MRDERWVLYRTIKWKALLDEAYYYIPASWSVDNETILLLLAADPANIITFYQIHTTIQFVL